MELFYGHLLTPINLAKQILQSRVLQVKKIHLPEAYIT